MVRSLLANVWDGVNEMIDDTQHENLYGSYEWKHPTQVAGVPWKNPVATASGTFQYAAVRWFYDVSQLGAVTTKGVSPVPWEGNPGIRTAEGPSSNINAVGLQNPGVDHYLEDDLPKLKAINATVIANVAGHCDDDYVEVVSKLNDSPADMLEINVSCPNVANLSCLQNKEHLKKLLEGLIDFRRGQNHYRPILLKISPDLSDEQIDEMIEVLVENGLDGIVATNTTTSRQGLLTPSDLVAEIGNGGLSGGPLTERSLEMVRYIHKKTEGRFPIIGVGGIMTEDDAVAMLDAGASLIEVYTGFIYNGPGFAKRICKRLKEEAIRKEHAAREAKAAESPDTRNTL